jgi:hypothetical protein
MLTGVELWGRGFFISFMRERGGGGRGRHGGGVGTLLRSTMWRFSSPIELCVRLLFFVFFPFWYGGNQIVLGG